MKNKNSIKLITAEKIWDKAPHNAFTDLIWFEGHFYCAFREADHHMSYEGKLRVIRSPDANSWELVALMSWENGDVRDAKLSITPKNELMLNGGIRFENSIDGFNLQSVTWLSKDGKNWSKPYTSEEDLGTWRWSVTWNKEVAYSFSYTGKDQHGCLYRSYEGKSWEIVKKEVYPDVESYGNETSLLFLENNDAYCLLRRDKQSATAMLGYSKPPYTNWQWSDLGVRIGGPKMLAINNKYFLAAVRLYGKEDARTSLCWIDSEKTTLEEALVLPSGGDCSYAGMIEHDDFIWVSYYSSHEEKTSIYLAKVEIGEL
ncbi:MAG: hypothetical protein WC141_08545 [Arcobacteraceae bacterium]